MNAVPTANGLDGIVVADTRLSEVDGEAGRLVVAGSAIEELAGEVAFEELAARLLDGADAAQLARGLGAARGRAFALVASGALGDALAHPDAMSGLRAALAHLGDVDEVDAIAACGVFASAIARVRAGQDPLAPDASLPHAHDVARMTTGALDPSRGAALDAYLVTVMDHGMNASTFAARVVASTGADLASCLVAGVCALSGPLHGGAPGPVLDMLDAIGTAERARAWIDDALAQGKRLMGFGHRIYRVRDPRAVVLERAVSRLAGTDARLALARAVEKEATAALRARHPDRVLAANVEFFTAVLLEACGVPRRSFSTMFASGRIVGWCAHVREQRQTGRLIRPASNYVGPRIRRVEDNRPPTRPILR